MKFNDAFWRWFGNSVAKKKGVPHVFYHGTSASFSEFAKNLCGSSTLSRDCKNAFFFTDSADVAEDFAGYIWQREGENDVGKRYTPGANIIPVYLKIENPDIWEMYGRAYDENFVGDAIRSAKKDKRDSIVFQGMRDGSVSTVGPWKQSNIAVVFKPTQIKSAISNDGSYDLNDPDIRSNPRRRR